MTVYLLKTTLGAVWTRRLFKGYNLAVFCNLLYKLLYVFMVLLKMNAGQAESGF